jgi:uncharacterized membrane protein YhaH (DUF805 family)
MNWINLLLGSKGRINRKTFFVGLVPILVLFGLLVLYIKLLTGILPSWADILIPALIALEALHFLSRLSLKRMHDYGRSAFYQWYLFSPLIIVGLVLIQQKFFHLQSYEGAVLIYTVLISLAVIAFFWMLIEMMFRRSDEQENKYGPPPTSTE